MRGFDLIARLPPFPILCVLVFLVTYDFDDMYFVCFWFVHPRWILGAACPPLNPMCFVSFPPSIVRYSRSGWRVAILGFRSPRWVLVVGSSFLGCCCYASVHGFIFSIPLLIFVVLLWCFISFLLSTVVFPRSRRRVVILGFRPLWWFPPRWIEFIH